MVWSLLNKLKIEPPYDPAIQLLATYLEKHFQKDISTLMFIAALFTAANTWKQAKCPTNRGMDKEDVVYAHTYIYNGILLSHKKE